MGHAVMPGMTGPGPWAPHSAISSSPTQDYSWVMQGESWANNQEIDAEIN